MIMEKAKTQSRDSLIEENLGLIQLVICHKFNNPQDTNFRDELYSCGLVGLWLAASTYDSSKSQFSTYAYTIIYREMLYWVNKQLSHKNRYVQYEPPSNNCSIKDFSPTLSEQEETILKLKCEGYTLKEIGEQLGFSATTTFHKIEKIKNKIRLANDIEQKKNTIR